MPLLGAIVGGVARKLIPAAGKAIGRIVGGAAKRPGTTAAAAAAGTAIINRVAGRPAPGAPPPMPRGFAPQGAPRPREGVVGRTISRILPGGRTGREFMPYEGTERDKIGRPIAVYHDRGERYVVPSGYVLVKNPQDPDGEPIAVLKGAARALGLWKPRPKPPVSGWDLRAITRAAGAKKRVKALAGKVGLKASNR
jgi:hypothetical protein